MRYYAFLNVNTFIMIKVTGTPIIAAKMYANIAGAVGNSASYANTIIVCIMKFGIYDIKYFTNFVKLSRSLNVAKLLSIYDTRFAVT